MQSRKNGKARKGQPEGLTELIARVPSGHAVYKSGVDEGLRWAASAKPPEVGSYRVLRHEDVTTHIEVEMLAPNQMSLSLSFPGRFEPPDEYREGLPVASLREDELAVRLFWTGWLDGVHEVEARVALATLIAPRPAHGVLVMDAPGRAECPVCWIERNLGVRVVIKSDHEIDEA
jgi:hypothetical protein